MASLSHITPTALTEHISSVTFAHYAGGHAEAPQISRYGAFVGSAITLYSSLERAMDKARQLISTCEEEHKPVLNGAVILAETLVCSKGRFQRSWHAPPGGVWGCLVLADIFLPIFRNFIPLIPGIACCEALHAMKLTTARIRWVNDVLAENKKLAGFLIETFSSPVHKEQFHLLGFGININNTTFPKELVGEAVSLRQLLGGEVDINKFALSFLASMRWYIGLLLFEEVRWLTSGGGEEYKAEHPILTRWKELSDTVGKRVRFGYDVLLQPQYEAFVESISHDGGLVLRHDDGTGSREYSGEIRYL